MSKIGTAEAGELIGVKQQVVVKLVKAGLLTNLTPSENGKRRQVKLSSKEVREVKRFYEPKGKDWRRRLLAAREAAKNPVVAETIPSPVPNKRAEIVRRVRVALDTAEAKAAARPPVLAAGVLTTLKNLEEAVAKVQATCDRLEAIWK